MKIKSIRLINGDQIVCELSDESTDTIKIKKGFVVSIDQESNRLRFNPVAPFSVSDVEIEIAKINVTFVCDASYWIVDQYNDLIEGKLPQQ